MKTSLRKRILAYYQKNPGVWISGGELERIASNATTYKPSTISRRARELAEDNLLERKEVKGTVFYAYKPQPKTTHTPVFIEKDGKVVVQLKEEVITV